LQFNISHSGTTAPIALVRGCQIGGDVERIPTDLEAEAIAERFLSAAEKELLSAVPQQRKYAAFFHASTAKKPYSRPGGGLPRSPILMSRLLRANRPPCWLLADPGGADR